MGQSTISMAIFNSKLLVHQRVGLSQEEQRLFGPPQFFLDILESHGVLGTYSATFLTFHLGLRSKSHGMETMPPLSFDHWNPKWVPPNWIMICKETERSSLW